MTISEESQNKELANFITFVLKTRISHKGNRAGALVEIVNEPDIIEHWNSIEEPTKVELVAEIVTLVHEAKKKGGAIDVHDLPDTIRNSRAWSSQAEISCVLMRIHAEQGSTECAAEITKITEALETRDLVTVGAILLMCLFPPIWRPLS